MPQPTVLSESVCRNAGVLSANACIDEDTPEQLEQRLAEADRVWNDPNGDTPIWLAFLSGYRDTLREHLERSNDA